MRAARQAGGGNHYHLIEKRFSGLKEIIQIRFLLRGTEKLES